VKSRNVGKKEYVEIKGDADRLGEHNDCAVKAVALTCRVPYGVAHVTLKQLGRSNGRGTPIFMTEEAIEKLGYEMVELKRNRQPGGSRYTPKTIGERLKRGYWLCRVRHHIFAVVNGMVLDWTDGRQHRIERIYRVTKRKAAA